MIHTLIILAVVLFLAWLFFHATFAIANLLWLVIAILVVMWLVGFFRRSSRTY